MKASFFTLLFTAAATLAAAQEQLGLKLGNYAGVHALQLNPSWAAGGPLVWDVNIVSAGAFAHQDYIYGEKASMLKWLRRGGEVVTDGTPAGDGTLPGSESVPFYFQENRNYDGQQLAVAMAPSFLVNRDRHSFGFYLTGRSWMSAYDLDGDLGYYSVTDSNIYVGSIDPMQTGAMAWAEAAFHYGAPIRTRGRTMVHIGGTAKLLLGSDALSVRNLQATDVYRDDDQIALGPTNLDMAWATGYDADDGYSFERNGWGAAADIGVTWTSPDTRGRKPYRWKVGVSLIDVGRIWYRKEASVYSFTSADSSFFSLDGFEEVGDPEELIDAINASANTASAELSGSKFGMWTPMAVSAQFDAPLVRGVYLSGTAVVGMRFRSAAVERSDLLAVTPRFEHRWVEVGLPVSLYRWKELQVGTYLRLGPLTVGTETLHSWLMPGRLEGSDVYVALKIHSGMFGKERKNGGRGNGCYATDF